MGVRIPSEIYKATGFLINIGSDRLKNHKTTKPEFNVGPSSAGHTKPFKWRFAGGSITARL